MFVTVSVFATVHTLPTLDTESEAFISSRSPFFRIIKLSEVRNDKRAMNPNEPTAKSTTMSEKTPASRPSGKTPRKTLERTLGFNERTKRFDAEEPEYEPAFRCGSPPRALRSSAKLRANL